MQHVTDDDFDENGILKDGHRYRVPMMMMDHQSGPARPLVTDASGGTAGLHRPGFRVSDASAGDERQRARDDYERDLCNDWKHDADVPRSKQNAGADGFSIDARQAAYQKYDEEAQQAWRHAK